MDLSSQMWAGFIGIVTFLILFDLLILGKLVKSNSFKIATAITLCWVSLAILFALGIFFYDGQERALLFLTGYIIELTLSLDNIFVFILIFNLFYIKPEYQHKVLFIGILSAILMRLGMISIGLYLVKEFEWIFYIFGAFLIYSGLKIFKEISKPEESSNKENALLKILKKYINVSENNNSDKLFVKEDGKWMITNLFVVLVLIEQADLIFALDSIPAILAITNDLFIVFTSNVFAILGLRSMYFMLSSIIEKFVYIKYAMAIILLYIGCKMILAVQGIHIPILVSLIFILSSIVVSILMSLIKNKAKAE